MKIVVIGAGLMGPTLAIDCMNSAEVDGVLLIDLDGERLKSISEGLGNPKKLKTLVQDVTDHKGLVEALNGYDATAIALLRPLNVHAIWGAVDAGVHAVDLSDIDAKDIEKINEKAVKSGVTIMPGCGVEPGLTDMLAAQGMDKLDRVESIDIWCGGIPQNPRPPLDYRIVFGGPYLPLRPGVVKVIEGGRTCEVKRYTLGEPVYFEGINRPLECFYDGFPDTLELHPKFSGIKRCTEKTVRYAGYREKVNFLDECGLLSRDRISFKGTSFTPFEVFSKIIYPKVRMSEDEKDITVLRVNVRGEKDGDEVSYTFDMVDFYDEERKVTSMARTTSYTASIIVRMLGRGQISEKGFIPPVRVIRGVLLKQLLDELAKRNVVIKQTVTCKSSTL